MHSMIVAIFLLMAISASAAENTRFNQTHANGSDLLSRRVQWNAEGTVDYPGFARHSKALDVNLAALSNVGRGTFNSWNQNERQAFLALLRATAAGNLRSSALS